MKYQLGSDAWWLLAGPSNQIMSRAPFIFDHVWVKLTVVVQYAKENLIYLC